MVQTADDIDAALPADEAIPQLLDRYGGAMFRLAERMCGHSHEAEDLVQETFLRAYRGWPAFDGRSSSKTWLFTIAARTCQRLHRKRAGQPARLEPFDEEVAFTEPHLAVTDGQPAGPDKAAERRDMHERLEAAIGTLPSPFRIPLVLKDILDMSIEDVAQILGLRPQTVKTRVHRARMRLRQSLVRGLPSRPGTPAIYSRQVCLDLLHARQEALDRGAPFPDGAGVLCERCRSVFATLELGHNLCHELGQGQMPRDLRRRLLAAMS